MSPRKGCSNYKKLVDEYAASSPYAPSPQDSPPIPLEFSIPLVTQAELFSSMLS